MNPATLTREEQQRLLQRGIENVQRLLNRAFASQLIADFEFVYHANAEFKTLVAECITSTEIHAAAAQLPQVDVFASYPSFFRFFFFYQSEMFYPKRLREKRATVQNAKALADQYANLQLLVKMMEP